MSGAPWILTADIELGEPGAGDLAIGVLLPTGIVNVPGYIGALTASGGTPAYTYAISAGSLPSGLSLDTSTGAVTGTPNTVGYYEFTASVTDSAGSPATASKVVSILVVSGIAFTGNFAQGEVGIAYSSGLSASGGVAPYTWTISSGSAPTSLTINSTTGVVSGTPTVAGTFNLTVTATDSNGDPQDFPTSITIALAVDLSTSTFPGGTVGGFYSAGPTTIGGVAPFTYSISSGAIPAGTTFSSSTGFVSGQPTTAATYTFHVTVLDTLGGTSTYNASVIITAGAGGAGVTSVNGATGVVTETSNDGSLGHTDAAGSGGNIDWTARLLAKLVTAAALPANTYANGTAGVGATLTGNATGTLTVDGVLVALNDFVLVTQEASGLKCGLYKCTTAGAVGVAYVLTRATRMDSSGKYVGAQVFITGGSTGAIRVYACSNQTAPTVGTTSITFNAITFSSGVNGTFSNMSATILNGIVIAAANGSATTDIQIFSSSGTWTKPPNAKSVRVYALGAGGGAASGVRVTGGANTLGSPGGGGGASRDETSQAASCGSTETVTIGVGGTGGALSTTSTRNAGTSGGNTTFGSLLTAFGGGGNPSGGAGSGNSPGSGAGSLQAGNTPATVSTTAIGGRVGGTSNVSGNTTLNYDATSAWGGAAGGAGASANIGQRGGDASGGGPGGGCGGGQSSTNGFAGGDGGASTGVLGGAGGTGGGSGTGNGGNASNGSNPTTLLGAGSGGGGGGSGNTGTTGTKGGAGGNGARGAGGGGGGNGELALTGGAKGGDGGPGYCVVITLCSI